MLKLNGIDAGYGKLGVLWDVSFNIDEGEFVALLGANGVGKTQWIADHCRMMAARRASMVHGPED